MSEQDKKSNPPALGGPSVLVVDQTQGSRQKQLFRATELQQEAAELHHKRSRAFGVPCEELKDICQEANGSNDPDNKEEKEQNEQKEQDVVLSDKQKQMLTKKLSSSHKKHDTSDTIQCETITLAPVNVDNKINLDTKVSVVAPGTVTPQSAPSVSGKELASQLSELRPEVSEPPDTKPQEPITVIVNEESTKDEIAEQPKGEIDKKQSDWSYLEEEQAGGLPRETRASRVSRSVRTFFCCGVPYEAPSEDDVSVENYVSASSSRCYYTLDEKASVGPCKPATCLERPSGICISLPKRSSISCNLRDQGPMSGISLVVRKRGSRPSVNIEMREIHSDPNGEMQASSDECFSESSRSYDTK